MQRHTELAAAALVALCIAGTLATVGAATADTGRVAAMERRIVRLELQADSLGSVIDLQGAAIETLERELREVVAPVPPMRIPAMVYGRSRR